MTRRLSIIFKVSLLLALLYLVAVTVLLFTLLEYIDSEGSTSSVVWVFHYNIANFLDLENYSMSSVYLYVWLGEIFNAILLFGVLYCSLNVILQVIQSLKSDSNG